ncbi:hypothetical protein BC830DRAFT_165093 [Chytriomyces sp. MP71]|nr:hypothetical protein BC830DRAFT_165093 [Chytriomyces sp. MP71]
MDPIHQSYALAGLSVTAIAVLLNLLILVPNVHHVPNLLPSSFLIIWICVGDLISSINSLIITSTLLLTNGGDYNSKACQVQGAVYTFGCILSIAALTGLAEFRFRVVVLKTDTHRRIAPIFIFVVILVAATQVSLPFLMNSAAETYILHQTRMVCAIAFHSRETKVQAVALVSTVGICIPLLFLGFAYAAIYMQVRRVSRRLKENLESDPPQRGGVRVDGNSAEGEEAATTRFKTSGGAGPKFLSRASSRQAFGKESLDQDSTTPDAMTINKRALNDDERREKKLLIQSVAIVCLFLVGWGPWFVLMVKEGITGSPVTLRFEFVADLFMLLTAALNPCLVLIFDDTIRANVAASVLGKYW